MATQCRWRVALEEGVDEDRAIAPPRGASAGCLQERGHQRAMPLSGGGKGLGQVTLAADRDRHRGGGQNIHGRALRRRADEAALVHIGPGAQAVGLVARLVGDVDEVARVMVDTVELSLSTLRSLTTCDEK